MNLQTARDSIETYIRAKDQNRPHLMASAFAPDAKLGVVVKTGAISFPPRAMGLEGITDTLVRTFAQSFENIYTFCLAAPVPADAPRFSCEWLVGMSEKETRSVRVGCGCYNWIFQTAPPRLVQQLAITIEVMQVLSPDTSASVMGWLSELPYPWCAIETATEKAPKLDDLRPVLHYLAAASHVAQGGPPP